MIVVEPYMIRGEDLLPPMVIIRVLREDVSEEDMECDPPPELPRKDSLILRVDEAEYLVGLNIPLIVLQAKNYCKKSAKEDIEKLKLRICELEKLL